jgi:ABC-2 type transport system ATP-binding protein
MKNTPKTVVKVDNLYKSFKLPTEKVSSVKSIFTNMTSVTKKNYLTQKALRGISFEVKEGEFFGIVGRNGSGKSTLLKLLGGIYQPTKGSVQTKGKVVPFIELGVGFNPELSGKDNVFLNGAMLGFTSKEVLRKYRSIIEFAELERFMDQKLKNYSSGMQVRLAFSVATILADSDVLLLDEVLAVGDAEFQRKCFNYFRKLKKNKKTVIFVSHDMNAVKDYCDRAILIEDGKIVSEGSSNSVANEYTKLFIPTEQINEQSEDETNRWGNKDIVFTELSISPKKVTDQDTITLVTTLKVNKNTSKPLIGFSLKSASDERITGTNSKIQGIDIKRAKKGQEITLEWEIPNVLNDGRHFINVAVENEELEACDWWEDALEFEVYRNSETGFVVHVPIKAKITKLTKDK